MCGARWTAFMDMSSSVYSESLAGTIRLGLSVASTFLFLDLARSFLSFSPLWSIGAALQAA